VEKRIPYLRWKGKKISGTGNQRTSGEREPNVAIGEANRGSVCRKGKAALWEEGTRGSVFRGGGGGVSKNWSGKVNTKRRVREGKGNTNLFSWSLTRAGDELKSS